MDKTFTYTARSADNPDRAITVTLRGDKVYLQLDAPLPVEPEESEEEWDVRDRLLEEARIWLKPMAFRMLERGLAPFRAHDVFAGSEDDGFWLAAWVRVAGLRLMPIVVAIGTVDNPEGASDFVAELEEQKRTAPSTGTLFGPLDFWATWVAAAALILVFGRKQFRRST
jgi:hypothetical protein